MIDNMDAWKQVPPEEKLELLSRAHAVGVVSATIAVIIGCTIAVGLQIPAIIWGSLLCCPFIFQFSAGRAWRGYKPQVVLQYLAARSAARRYAFTANSKDLNLQLIMRANLEQVFNQEKRTEQLEAAIANNQSSEVWLAIFTDCLVIMAERPGGAQLVVGNLLNDKLTLSGTSPTSKGEYANDRELLLTAREKNGKGERQFKITSKYPAATIVLEKRFLQLQNELKRQADSDRAALLKLAETAVGDDDGPAVF